MPGDLALLCAFLSLFFFFLCGVWTGERIGFAIDCCARQHGVPCIEATAWHARGCACCACMHPVLAWAGSRSTCAAAAAHRPPHHHQHDQQPPRPLCPRRCWKRWRPTPRSALPRSGTDCTHAHACARTHTHTHTHTQTHTNAHTHTHRRARMGAAPSSETKLISFLLRHQVVHAPPPPPRAAPPRPAVPGCRARPRCNGPTGVRRDFVCGAADGRVPGG
jgi:hypothetical protein